MKETDKNCRWFIKPIGSDSNEKIAKKLGQKVYDSEEDVEEVYEVSKEDVKDCFRASFSLEFRIMRRIGNGKLVDVTDIARKMFLLKGKKKAQRDFKKMKK